MKTNMTLLVAAGALVSSVFPVDAQLPVSVRSVLAPASLTNGVPTLVGVPVTREAESRHTVSSAAGGGGNTIDDTGAAFGTLSGTHVVRLLTTADYGETYPISSNTATVITVAGSLPALTTDDEFEVVPLNTLESALGSPPLSLAGGNFSTLGADIVIAGGTEYYFDTGVGFWRTVAQQGFGPSQNDVVIPEGTGLFITKNVSSSTSSATVRGVANSTRTVSKVADGVNLLSYPYAGEVTLDESGLSDSVDGGNFSTLNADIIIAGGVEYYFDSGVNFWRTVAQQGFGPDQGAVTLNPSGAGFVFTADGAKELVFLERFAE